MYIWILLATIMVAFSFYNVSPRADKDHALNEIRAATVTNRFKIEHKAMLKMFECEILYQLNSDGWDGSDDNRTSASGPVDVTKFNPGAAGESEKKSFSERTDGEFNPANNTFEKHIPLGYNTEEDKSIFPAGVHHFIYCLDTEVEKFKDGEGEGETATPKGHFVRCDTMQSPSGKKTSSRTRYLVTFAQVPEKWLTKTDDHSPLPVLTNTLSKEGKSSTSYGWTQCEDGKCRFMGINAVHGNTRHKKDSNNYEKNADGTYSKKSDATGISFDIRVKDNDCEKNEDGSNKTDYKKDAEGNPILDENDKPIMIDCIKKTSMRSDHVYELDKMPENSIFWDNEDFKTLCANQACLFAFEQIPATDTAFHCYNLLACGGKEGEEYEKCKKSNHYKEKKTGDSSWINGESTCTTCSDGSDGSDGSDALGGLDNLGL